MTPSDLMAFSWFLNAVNFRMKISWALNWEIFKMILRGFSWDF